MRQDQFAIHFSVTDPDSGAHVNLGIWDKADGGDVDSTETKYRPGAGAEEITIGGAKTTGNLTIHRLCNRDVDGVDIARWMRWAGRARCTASIQYLTPNYDATGGPALVYSGQIKKVTPPAPDSTAQGPAIVAIEISVAGLPA